MAKIKFKFDTKKLVAVLKTRFEFIALGVAGVLAAGCLILGFGKFLSASDPEPKILQVEADLQNQRRNAPSRLDKKKKDKSERGDWLPASPEVDYLALPRQLFFEPGAAGENRREKPEILAVNNDPKSIQLDYVPSAIYTFDINQTDEKLNTVKDAGKGILDLFYNVEGKRLVVVSGTFPYHKQCEKFMKALRVESIDELFKLGLQPTFEGIIVERCEVVGGKEDWNKAKKIYGYDPADYKAVVAKPIEDMLKTCLLDEKFAEKYADVIYGSTVTPLPLLVRGDYPALDIGGYEKRLPASVPDPKGKGVVVTPEVVKRGQISAPRGHSVPQPRDAEKPNLEPVDFKNLPPVLMDQIKGKLNWFDPYGGFLQPPDDDKGDEDSKTKPKDPQTGEQAKGKRPVPMPQPGMPGVEVSNPKAPAAEPKHPGGKIYPALIRFVDVDVEPGKSYKYRFKLRLANPNYGQSTKVVLNSEFAKNKEFETPGWAVTETKYIPKEYYFYVINQEAGFLSKAGGPGAINRETGLKTHDKVPFQIQTYVDAFTDDDNRRQQVADWLIAERLLVGRGEPVGRRVEVELPAWNKFKNKFELVSKPGGPKLGGFVKGIGVDFSPKSPIILLDFVGGKQRYHSPKGGSIDDDSACEALLLLPDGNLMVRNSRNDMNDEGWDGKLSAGHPYGVERRRHFETWRARLMEFYQPKKAEK